MLAPLYQRVPPAKYGGTERVVSYLTEELVRRGHDVTLYACAGSRTSARLVEVAPGPLDELGRLTDPVAYHVFQLGLAVAHASAFDLIHSHCDFRALPFVPYSPIPVLSTNHNRLDAPENVVLLDQYPDAPLTAVSQSHQRQLPRARWIGVCRNGIPVLDFPFGPGPGHYLAFVGRISPEKGPLAAIEVAEQTGVPLKIVAKVNEWERRYFEQHVEPRLHSPLVEFLGELDESGKRAFLADALALLFPIGWDEPFGMVTIEAMATGTPVLGFKRGSVPELVDDGVTGFVCNDVATMSALVSRLTSIDRTRCRARALERFSVTAMADQYEAAYARLLGDDRF